MSKRLLLLLGALSAITAVTAHAQTYNDVVRTNTWSVYGQAGISNYHGVRSSAYDNTGHPCSPDLSLGVKYNYKPWVRFGFNTGWTMAKAIGREVISTQSQVDGFMVGDHETTLYINEDRIQNKNDEHLYGFDFNADFNFMQIWPQRKAQWCNIYFGTGLGYIHGWNTGLSTVSYRELAVAEGAGFNNVYTHNYMKSEVTKGGFDGMYIPVSLSFEFDILRKLTVGLVCQYKYLPINKEYSPVGIYTAAAVVRYNFVDSESKIFRKKVADLQGEVEAVKEDRNRCAEETARVKESSAKEAERLNSEVNDLSRERDELKKQIDRGRSSAAVYFEEGDSTLSEKGCEDLDILAESLAGQKDRDILLFASASTLGTDEYNEQLSAARLESVKKYLVDAGVSEDRFKVKICLGEYKMDNTPESRRVVVVAK